MPTTNAIRLQMLLLLDAFYFVPFESVCKKYEIEIHGMTGVVLFLETDCYVSIYRRHRRSTVICNIGD